jgi:antitoxin ParD1/3/4/toxin ParE1/3/4
MRVLDRLERAFLELAEMPRLGHRREDLTPERFRFWPVYEYLVVYDPDTSPLGIVRVLHGHRDVGRELESD